MDLELPKNQNCYLPFTIQIGNHNSLHKQCEKSWLLSKPSILKVRNVNQEEKEIILSHHYQEKDFDGRLPNEARKRNSSYMQQNLDSYKWFTRSNTRWNISPSSTKVNLSQLQKTLHIWQEADMFLIVEWHSKPVILTTQFWSSR